MRKHGTLPSKSIYMLYGLLCLVPFIAACGKSDLETFPVSGEVRFRGKPAAGAVIMFHRKVESDDRKILLPNGRTDQLGRFILGTYAQNDARPPGNIASASFGRALCRMPCPAIPSLRTEGRINSKGVTAIRRNPA